MLHDGISHDVPRHHSLCNGPARQAKMPGKNKTPNPKYLKFQPISITSQQVRQVRCPAPALTQHSHKGPSIHTPAKRKTNSKFPTSSNKIKILKTKKEHAANLDAPASASRAISDSKARSPLSCANFTFQMQFMSGHIRY